MVDCPDISYTVLFLKINVLQIGFCFRSCITDETAPEYVLTKKRRYLSK